MTDTTDHTITIRIDDEVLFRLRDGRQPLIYPDTVARASYATGIDVLHIGTVWALGHVGGVEALELDDGTVVAAADIDPDSVVVNPTAIHAGLRHMRILHGCTAIVSSAQEGHL